MKQIDQLLTCNGYCINASPVQQDITVTADEVRYSGDTSCAPTTMAWLPEAEQKQAGLMSTKLINENDKPVALIK